MLTIRNEQFAKLSQRFREKFEARLTAHAERFFPKECQAAGPEGLSVLVRSVIPLGQRYQLEAEKDLVKLLGLMLIFGANFDTDPQLGWLIERLVDGEVTLPAARLDRAYAEAIRRVRMERRGREILGKLKHGR